MEFMSSRGCNIDASEVAARGVLLLFICNHRDRLCHRVDPSPLTVLGGGSFQCPGHLFVCDRLVGCGCGCLLSLVHLPGIIYLVFRSFLFLLLRLSPLSATLGTFTFIQSIGELEAIWTWIFTNTPLAMRLLLLVLSFLDIFTGWTTNKGRVVWMRDR